MTPCCRAELTVLPRAASTWVRHDDQDHFRARRINVDRKDRIIPVRRKPQLPRVVDRTNGPEWPEKAGW